MVYRCAFNLGQQSSAAMLGLSESGFVRGGAGWGLPEKITFTIHFRRYVSDCQDKCF